VAKYGTAVVISDENGQVSEEDEHRKEVVAYLESIGANYKNLESYEKSVVDSFKHNEDGVELLIVVDKLLTGFDAPRNTVLYLAKDLHDHGLLQAIARVNRLFDNEEGRMQKTTGYIIDYSENAKNLKHAMQLFGNFEADDMKGTLIDVGEKIKELEEAHADIHEMFKELTGSKDDEAYIRLLADEQKRDLFYENMKHFVRVFKECFALQEFADEFKEIDQYQMDLKKLMELQRAASLQYADRVDFGKFKQALVKILDKYVNAEGVELLTKQISLADTKAFSSAVDELGSPRSKAEAIAAQTERTIKEDYEKDPEFFQSFSEKVKKVLEEMRAGKLADVQALKDLKELSESVRDRKDEGLPSALMEHKGAGIFYRNLQSVFDEHGVTEDVKVKSVLGLYEVLEHESIVDWYRNMEVKRVMTNKLDDYLYDVVRGAYDVELTSEEVRDMIERVMALAENNHELF
jgi:type I restriction enzyme, R subunit